MDLVLQGTLTNLRALLQGRGLLDASNNPTSGFDYCLWAGTGKFMTAKATYDTAVPPNQLTPPSYLAGLVILARISLASDIIANPVDSEQWSRSQVAAWIKANGVLGTFGGMPCYTVNSVRMMRAPDVFAWCATNSMPGHEWLGGNNL